MQRESYYYSIVYNILYLQSVLLRRAVADVQRTGYEIVLDVDNEEYVDGSYNLQYKLSCHLYQSHILLCENGPYEVIDFSDIQRERES